MTYGIDLGTTNSLIGHNGNVESGLVPSIVDMQAHKAGESERNNYNTLRGFKTSMTTDQGGFEAIVASSEVLKELKCVSGLTSKVDVVISVPAYFNNSQRLATIKAADIAGMSVKALINEPTAAAMAISRGKQGTSVVFDLGGGTFDISVIQSENNKYRVIATDGCILGGNDFDYTLLTALANKCNLNWRLDDDNKAKDIACKAKIKMSNLLNNKKPVSVVFSDYGAETELTYEMYIECMKSTFSKAITLTKNVIDESGIDISMADFYFVGGSTRCPFLRAWVEEELGIQAAPIIYNPDMIVAEGACYYAQLIDEGQAIEVLEDVSKQIGFAVNGGKVLEVIVPKNSRLPYHGASTHIVSETDAVTDAILSFYEGDSILTEDCEHLGDLNFTFKEKKLPGASVYDVEVTVDLNGRITVKCSEILEEPQTVVMEVV